ncbi:MAG: hypothetical protein IJA86_08505 [Clostridia bacterium]|nr:hypothetical protein [Clostridia bacterium]
MGKIYTSAYPDCPPEWYWTSGLHDACIEGVEAFEFPFDYGQFTKNKYKYQRNLLVLKINANGALYDRTVREIRFFNYTVLTDHISLKDRKKIWWLSDTLTDHGKYYTLKMELQDFESYPEDFTFEIQFERAETERYNHRK